MYVEHHLFSDDLRKIIETYIEGWHEWLKKIPRNRKAATVRHAIRFYIACNDDNSGLHMSSTCSADMIISQTNVLEQQMKKKKPKLPTDGHF